MKATELRIGNFNGYKVREDGVIFSKRHGKPMKYYINDKGYPCVSLSVKGKCITERVHRVVAKVFIPNPNNKPQVNHKDRNRSNYNLSNLEWCTASENVIHSVKNGGRDNWTRNNQGENNPNAKHSFKKIEAIRFLYKNEYSQNQLAEIFNMSQGRISKIVNNKIWISES